LKVARIELAPEIQKDFDRIFVVLAEHVVEDASHRIKENINAFDVLQHNPLMARPASVGMGELVIGRSARGSIALYCYIEPIDTVFVLAIRSQREAGYAGILARGP
jgi:plasmid stabilization system protein ParE